MLIDEALTSLTQKPIKSTTIERVCLLHEADLLLRGQPRPLQYGKGMYDLLGKCSLPLKETDLLLGRIVDKVLTDEEEACFQSINPRYFAGEEGLKKLSAVMGGFFDMGGLQLQITCVDPSILLEAQMHPDQYRDLMVRITGCSAVFADMEKHAQDDIIKREVMAH